MSMCAIDTPLEAKGFFDALSDFFHTLAQDNNPQPQPNAKYTLSLQQAKNYIDLYVASLNNELRPNATSYDIEKINEKTYKAFNQSSTIYVWVSGIRMYNKDMIDQFLLSAIIEVVESNTYNYAYDQTKNSTTAAKITQTIRTMLMKLIEKKQVLDAYSLRPFFGYPLQQTIRTEIAKLHQHNTGYNGTTNTTGSNNTSGHQHTTYASQSCCICFDDFGGATERLFLKPCGHDMCTGCALDYFFPNNLPDQTKKCPLCRSWVDLEELYNDVL